MKNIKALSIIAAASLMLASAGLFSGCNKNTEAETTTQAASETTTQTTAQEQGAKNPLTGVGGYDEAQLNSRYIGIVVENSPQARPQWGLCSPDILIEYEVEGGISRMLWLYANASEVPEKVGPVRSARHDVVELAIGFDAIFVHCGGSDIAYETIGNNSQNLTNIDCNSYYECFFRDTERNVAYEHTGYVTGDALRSSLTSLGLRTAIKDSFANPFVFVQRALTGGTCNEISAAFSSSYKYRFAYNTASGLYTTYLNGSERVDLDGKAAEYKNVIILSCDNVNLNDGAGHIDMKLENGGSGTYASGGNYENIKWSKDTITDTLKLFTADGNTLTLNPGNTYIALVRSTQGGATVTG